MRVSALRALAAGIDASALRRSLIALCAIAGLIQAWGTRHTLNPDGISYLDMADAYREGRWSDAINGYWSPLYSWLLAAAGAISDSSASELLRVHAVNGIIFLVTLWAFDALVRALERVGDIGSSPSKRDHQARMLFSYALFAWTTLEWIGLANATPDLLVACLAFVAARALVIITLGDPGAGTFALLGVSLGAGYLAKSVMFYVGLLALVAAVIVLWRRGRSPLRVGIATIAFAVVCLPYVAALSERAGRPSLGTTGRLAYAAMVNEVQWPVHWQGGPEPLGTPLHPTRFVGSNPHIYEFGAPIRATYAPWYDPSYWYDGVRPHLDVRQQARTLRRTTFEYLDMLQPLLVVFAALLLAMPGPRVASSNTRLLGWTTLPWIAGMLAYAVVYLESRYVAGFVAVVALIVLHVTAARVLPVVTTPLLAGSAIVLFVSVALRIVPYPTALSPSFRSAELRAAEDLHRFGVDDGDPIAVIDDGVRAVWARLARARIVAEVPAGHADLFWSQDAVGRAETLRHFAEAGAKAVVALAPRDSTLGGEWTRLGDGRWVARKLE